MQFKYPELLWALFILLIPIVIHLFQLRRFRKTPFTNVKFLKKVVSESRRSSTLKKWLLLFTRLAMLAALVIAFAQPFFAERSALQSKETVIYLDDSFSMQLKSDGATLLENAIQSIIKSVPKEQNFTLFTNERVFRDISLPEAQNDLLAITPTERQLELDQIYLKANTFFEGDSNNIKNLIVVSDFQKNMSEPESDTLGRKQNYLVSLKPDNIENVSIDSAYLNDQNAENIELTVLVSRIGSIESIPVSLFDGKQLIAKTSAIFTESDIAEVLFTLPKNKDVAGRLEVSDSGLAYDNHLYFTIDTKEKIKVLSIGDDSAYLQKIYPETEFSFTTTDLKNLNYGSVSDQNLIVLNEIPSVPIALGTSLKSFTKDGGSLCIIPAEKIDINSYNSLTSNYFNTSFTQLVEMEKAVSNISVSHPLYQGVFEKNVSNFQFPRVSRYYQVKTVAPTILSYQDQSPFLFGDDGVYMFSASISLENSNFKNSPLIVPTFYNIGSNSLKMSPLYGTLGNPFSLDIPISLSDDTVLKVKQGDYEFIPQQQSLSKKVSLNFDENLNKDGQYAIIEGSILLKNISFNYGRQESDLTYLDLAQFSGTTKATSLSDLFDRLEKDSRINALWKWFVIFAFVFLLIEILIQKSA